MRIRRFPLVLALSLLASGAGSAQQPDWVAVLLNAAMLPVSANAARAEGVPGEEVRAVIEAMRDKNVPAHEAREVLDEARNARKEHGPVDNFGAFVQSKLAAGLRGRELAAAIKAEHRARGKGKAALRGNAADTSRGTKGKSGAAAGDAKGKSGTAGDTKGKTPSARDDSGKAARPNAAGKGKRPSYNP